jgi:succinoglycan biosynthesis transport protein ExoP
MDLVFLGKVLWRKLWILVSVPLIAAFAAYLFTIDSKDTYVAKTELATGFTMQDQVQLTEEKFNSREADVKFANLMSSMNSGLSVNLTSYRLLLHDLDPKMVPYHRVDPATFSATPDEIKKVREVVSQKVQTFSPLASSDPEYLLVTKFLEAYGYNYNDIKDNLTIDRILNTDYIEISMAADKPGLASLGANAFSEEFIRFNESTKSERSSESVDFLKQLSDSKKAELDRKVNAQKMFKESNNVFGIEGESNMKMGQLPVLETQAATAQSNVHRLELTIQHLKDDIKRLSAPTTSSSNQKILDLRTRINGMNERYITGGSKNKALLDSLDFLREQLRMEQDNSYRQGATVAPGYTAADLSIKLKEAEIELDVQKTDLAQTSAKIRAINSSFSGYANKEAQLSAIQKEVDLANEEWTAALGKYNEAKNRQLTSNDLRLILVATPPVNPEPSIRLIIVGLAAFTSLILCVMAIVGLELMDGAVRTPEKFKRMVNLPIAGVINRIDSRNFNIRTYFNQQNGNEETEMFKSLLRKFRHEIESLNGKVILFTSPKKRDGKTFIMFSLSYVLSLLDKRVLIVDTNFKNNSLSQILGRGQSDLKVLDAKKNKLLVSAQGDKKEETEFEHENSYELINPTKYKNIYIVGNSGGGNESPAEILSGRDFTNLVSMLADSFDYVLMEGASLNDYSDTKELVKYADKVIAVFSAESSIKQFDRESIQYFKSLGKKFGGCVHNRVDTKDLKL